MTLPRVDEMSEPVVAGRFYLVPGIVYPWSERQQWWPVIGPKHEDADFFEFPAPHFHVDGRFLTKNEREWCAARGYRGDSYEHLTQAAPLASSYSDRLVLSRPPVTYRRRRAHIGQDRYVFGANERIKAIRLAYASDRLRKTERGWVCPHRGAHLGSIAPDERGVITCPLHGLRWCAKTGEARP